MKRLFKIMLSLHANPFSVKVVITVVAFAAVSCMIVMYELRAHMTEVLGEELRQKGQAIAREAAAQSIVPLQNGDHLALVEIAKNVSAKYNDVKYIIILDESGKPIAHNTQKNIPLTIIPSIELPDNRTETDVSTTNTDPTGEGSVLDCIVSINGGTLGWIRLGISYASMENNINLFSQRLLFTTILLTIIGVIGALTVAHLVTRPVTNLSNVCKKIAEGDFSQRVTTWGKDELAQMGKTFNQMASSIEKYTKEREALVEELKQNEQIRQELLKKVITAQEDERKRISRELHDETSQSLTSLIIGLKLLGNENINDKHFQAVSELKNVAAATLKEVHRLAVELRPTVLDDMGLIPAIERFIHGYSRNYNIDVDFHVQRKINERLPGELETALYRIVQEALTNIAKYANAPNVSVLLDIREEEVKLIVEDDGVGFDVEKTMQADTHLGIAGMKERTLLLNGKFTIESDAGQGTAIYACIPLKRRVTDEITN